MKLLWLSFLLLCFSTNEVTANTFKTIQEQDSLTYYYNMGSDPAKSNSLSRYRFYVRKKEESAKAKDTLRTIYFLRHIAMIQNNLGDYYGSEASAVEAIALLDRLEGNPTNNEARVALYNQLGRIHKALLNFDIALDYYNKALEITDDPKNKNIIQNNKFLIYNELKDYERAEQEFRNIYENSLLLDDIQQSNRALDNLGYIQSKLQRPEALSNLLKALKSRQAHQDLNGTYASYKHLSDHYLDRGDRAHAKAYADTAYLTAQLTHNVAYINDALSLLLQLSDDPIVTRYKEINDSITRAKQIEENKYALVKYNYVEQERLAKQHEIDIEKQKRLKLLYLALGGVTIVLAIALYVVLRAKYKREKLEQVYHTETRIAKKVHDEVANEVYHVMAKLQGTSTNNEQLLDDLESIYVKTRDISKENSLIDLTENFEELLNDLLVSYQSNTLNIITRGSNKMTWETVPDLKKVAIYRVLQELMTNMKKHSKATAVVVSFKKEGQKCHISYTDNGIGCQLQKQNGLHNTENRIHSLNGRIIFESEPNKGFKADIFV